MIKSFIIHLKNIAHSFYSHSHSFYSSKVQSHNVSNVKIRSICRWCQYVVANSKCFCTTSRLTLYKWRLLFLYNEVIFVSQSNLTYRGYWNLLSGFRFIGEMAIWLMAYRGFYFQAFDLSRILQSGFWFIGDLVIGLLTYRGFVIGLMVIGLLAIGLMSCSRVCMTRCLGKSRVED